MVADALKREGGAWLRPPFLLPGPLTDLAQGAGRFASASDVRTMLK